MMYELSKQLNKISREILWWRIVGLTDLILHSKIDMEEQACENNDCKKEVQYLVPEKQPDQDNGQEEAQPKSESLFNLQLSSQNREVGHIRFEPEMRFMLLRHWTLFDSIQNSAYMVSKMALDKEPGQNKLLQFLIEIGCPVDQAKQQWAFMDPEIKNSLSAKIKAKTDAFGLNDIFIESYHRQFSPNQQLSATDCAFAITSLLEKPFSQSNSK